MLWLMLHSSYYILYIHIRPSIPYIVGALSCIWGLLMRVFSGTGNAKYYRIFDRLSRHFECSCWRVACVIELITVSNLVNLVPMAFLVVARELRKTLVKYDEISGEVRQAISELSRELSTNEIALFSIVLSAEFGQKNLHSTENKSKKYINIKIFLQNFKCSGTTAKDLVISAKISEVNVIFNVILMFEVSRLPATC